MSTESAILPTSIRIFNAYYNSALQPIGGKLSITLLSRHFVAVSFFFTVPTACTSGAVPWAMIKFVPPEQIDFFYRNSRRLLECAWLATALDYPSINTHPRL